MVLDERLMAPVLPRSRNTASPPMPPWTVEEERVKLTLPLESCKAMPDALAATRALLLMMVPVEPEMYIAVEPWM